MELGRAFDFTNPGSFARRLWVYVFGEFGSANYDSSWRLNDFPGVGSATQHQLDWNVIGGALLGGLRNRIGTRLGF